VLGWRETDPQAHCAPSRMIVLILEMTLRRAAVGSQALSDP
jgi:hypothetical protein